MDKLTNLLKEHQIGEWCKRAAWIIAAIGLIEILLNAYALISQLQLANTSYNPPNWGLSMVYMFFTPLIYIAQTIFFFFVLYAAGTFLNHFVAEEDNEEETDELRVENEEYLKPGQFTKS